MTSIVAAVALSSACIPSPPIAAEAEIGQNEQIGALAARFGEIANEAREVWAARKAAAFAYLNAKLIPPALLWREGDPVGRGGWVTDYNGCTGERLPDFASIEAARKQGPLEGRLGEIITAYERYCSDCDRLRQDLEIDALQARLEVLLANKNAIIDELRGLRASSADALRAKAAVQAQQNVPYEEFQHRWGGPSDDAYGLLRSIQTDLASLPSLVA
ncbi:hypothetical protein [Rhodopseudomonas palustris]|uniref:hypothetical protein n=1 Tax=Rhodopseudomonas palustris TaxID=1076 RepID=UPI0021F35651|nr:hypothetical protein [Rhodopseudomonas palustris]UYO55711.1 hypothetical protein KQX61_10040 [Rhodopseudomonas palustris]